MGKIVAIIQPEKQRSFWQQLNYVTGKKRTRSATSVQITGESDMVTKLDKQEPMEDVIFAEVHGSRYTLAQGAPICRGKLFEDFCYLADTAAAEEVLNRSYLPPPDCNAATRDLFAEVAAI